MSLNWSTQKVKYFQENPDELWTKFRAGTPEEYEDLNVATKSLVFGCMAVGLGDITYKTAPVWYARWKIFEKYDNFYLFSTYDGNQSIKTYLTPDVIKKHIGLGTNVSNETDTKWLSRVVEAYKRDGKEVSLPELKNLIKQFVEEYENSH